MQPILTDRKRIMITAFQLFILLSMKIYTEKFTPNNFQPTRMKKHNILSALFITVSAMLLFNPFTGNAQKKKPAPHDTSYYVTYPGTVTARIYLSKKYAPFTLPGPGSVRDLEYRPNTKMNLGIGVTYNNYTLNVAYGFGFLNKNLDEKGKTKGLDLHFHLFPHNLTVDLLGIFHKGYYLFPKGYGSTNSNNYYYRQDVKITQFGLAAYRVPNGSKFSYKAAFVQNEWQKKSAGSILFGGQASYISFDADSALVPKQLAASYPQQSGINKISFISVGPGIGYAYTLVLGQHFFITPSVIGNLNVNFLTEETTSKNKKVSVKPAAIYKGAIGYNSDSWSIAVTLTGNALLARGSASSKDYLVPTGNYRVTIAKKIMVKK